jgi:excisionase family DNA binding protein
MDTNNSQPEAQPRLAWPIADAAKAIGISQSQLRIEVGQGRLPAIRLGRRLLIADHELRAFLNDRTTGMVAAV